MGIIIAYIMAAMFYIALIAGFILLGICILFIISKV